MQSSLLLPRFCPLRRFSSLREPLNSGRLARLPVPLRSQDLTPSQRFAPPETYRAYFIPIPSMGFPFRGFDPNPKPYVLSNAASLLALSLRSTTRDLRASPPAQWIAPAPCPRLQGLAPRTPFQSELQGLARDPNGFLLRVFSLRVFCTLPVADPFRSRPLPCFVASQASLRCAGTSGFTPAVRGMTLFRDPSTPAEFPTSSSVSTLWQLRHAGDISSPRKPSDVAVVLRFLFAHRQTAGRSSLRRPFR